MQCQSSSTDRESPSISSDTISDISSPFKKDVEMRIYAGVKTDEELVSSKFEAMGLEASPVSETFSSVDDNMKSPDSLESTDIMEGTRSPDPSTDHLEGVSVYREAENVELTPSTSAFLSLLTRITAEIPLMSSQYGYKCLLLGIMADLRTGTFTTEKAALLLTYSFSIPQFETEIESIRRFWDEFYIPKSDGFDENDVTGETKQSGKKRLKILTSPSKLFKCREVPSSRKISTEIESESGPEPAESAQCQSADRENPLEDAKIPRYLYQINAEVRLMLLRSSEAAEQIMRFVYLSPPEAYLRQILKYMIEYQSLEQELVKIRIQCSELLTKIRMEQLYRMRSKTSPDQSEEGQEVNVPFLTDKFELARSFLVQVMKFLKLLQNLSQEINDSNSALRSAKSSMK